MTNDELAATETAALEILTHIAREVPRYGGRLSDFAYSIDAIDKIAPEALRRDAMDLAKLVASASDELVERTRVALFWACQGDDYARKEIAGRFRSGVERLQLIHWIERHPRAGRFGSLMSALAGKRFTKAQLDLGRKLAAEARRAA